jgi:outer membrane protein TolC
MKKLLSLIFLSVLLNASAQTGSDPLTLDEAINILKSQNLEIKTASLDVDSAKEDIQSVKGNHYGKLDFIQDIARSNDAGNVFGFKLTSREATFGDFGFSEFLTPLGGAIYGASQGTPPSDMSSLLATQPNDLNYPESRNFYQSKLKYEVPIFTGFQISSYSDIMEAMSKMKTLEKDDIVNEKIYQLRKSIYDMALLKNSINNLKTIFENIETLEDMTKNMLDVGYAKKVDLLEVQAKKGNVARLLNQMESNKQLLYHYISFLLNEKVTAITTPSHDVPMPSFTNEEILQSNIDIQKAQTGLEVREGMVNVSKSAFYPMVGAFAEVATADDTFLGDARDHKAYTVGARLTLNIFNGGIDGAKFEKAKIEHLKTKTQVQLAQKGIELKISKIRTEIESYDADIASLQNELELANEIYKNYEGRYVEKLSSMSDVIIKQSEQIQKVLELQMAHNKRNERIFALEKLANGEQKQ